jgi:enterochelin esterase-like enzyme
MRSARILLLLCTGALPTDLSAQDSPRPPNTYHVPKTSSKPRAPFPDVHRDRTVTFHIAAPDARDVRLQLDGAHAMAKDSAGNWSVTIGPLAPEIYEYSFVIDGAKVLDAPNPFVKMGDFAASLVDIPGTPARFDEIRDVPHGALNLLNYTSSTFKKWRNLYVYLPPQYATETTRKFPVLYLRHGNGDNETAWPFEGRAGVILENLIADGKAVPMVIVMPYGESNATGAGTPEGIDALDRELRDDIMPLVERRYRVLTDRQSRAIAGLSMGGGQAFTIGLKHLDRFAWIGEFSSGLVSDADFRIEKSFPEIVANSSDVNRKLRLLFLSCGTEDPRYAGHLDLLDALTSHHVHHVWYPTPGVHEFKVWRHALHDFLPRLFQSSYRRQPDTGLEQNRRDHTRHQSGAT